MADFVWRNDRPFSRHCPFCDKLTIQSEKPNPWRLYRCCQCNAQFTVFPGWAKLFRLKPKVRCIHKWCPYRQDQKK